MRMSKTKGDRLLVWCPLQHRQDVPPRRLERIPPADPIKPILARCQTDALEALLNQYQGLGKGP